MSIIEAYLDLKAAFEKLDSQAKDRAYGLKSLAARLDAPVNQRSATPRIDVPSIAEIHALLALREIAWEHLHQAWDALPEDRQKQLSPPSARRSL